MDYPLKVTEQLRPQLQALRRQRGFTQAQLGQAVGVTQARIVEIEANPGVVSLQQIMQVLAALGATLVLRDADPGATKGGAGVDSLTPPGSSGEPSSRARKGRW